MSGEEGGPAPTPVEDLYWRTLECLEAFFVAAKTPPADGLGELAKKHTSEMLPALREYLERTPNIETVRKVFAEELCLAAEENKPTVFARALEERGRDPGTELKELQRRSENVHCEPSSWQKRMRAQENKAAEEADAVKAASMETLESVELYQRIKDQLQTIEYSRWFSDSTIDGRKVADADAEKLYILLRQLRRIAKPGSPLYLRLEKILGDFLDAGVTYDRDEFLGLCRAQDLEHRVLGHGNEIVELGRILIGTGERIHKQASDGAMATPEADPHHPETAKPAEKQHTVSPSPPVDTYVFRKVGDTWDVAFEGEHARGLKHTTGMDHIRTLLSQPHAFVSAHNLKLLPMPSVKERLSDAEGPAVGEGGSHQEVLDSEARSAYRERLSEIDKEAQDARGRLDVRRQEELESEKQEIFKVLKASTGKFGSKRGLGRLPAERAAQAVEKAIGRAQEHLRHKGLIKLADHLGVTIKRESMGFEYRPGPKPPLWSL